MDSSEIPRICSLGGGVTSCVGEFIPSTSFSQEKLLLLKLRRGLHSVSYIRNVCDKHFRMFFTHFEYKEIKCCDPLSHHTSAVAPVFVISLEMHYQSKQVSQFSSPLIPGKKLCKRCKVTVLNLLKDVHSTHECTSSAGTSQSLSQEDSVQQVLKEAGSIENVIFGSSSTSAAGGNSSQQASLPSESQPLQSLATPMSREDIENVIFGSAAAGEGSPEHAIEDAQPNVSVDLFEDEENEKVDPGSCSSSQATKSESSSQVASCSSEGSVYTPTSRRDAAIKKLNTILGPLNLTPVQKRKLTNVTTYGPSKLKKIEEECESLIVQAGGDPPGQDPEKIFYDKTMTALKAKFKSSSSVTDKIAILSIALVSMSRRTVLEEFQSVGATEYMVRKTQDLMKEQDMIFPVPAAKKGHSLPSETIKIIQSFYEEDDISSRQMPGKKDYVSVREGDQKVHKQKRLVLCTLKELHVAFKKRYPDIHVSFSKFASLRPRHCVLAGSSGTHSVCVCKHHQNFKLLIEALDFKNYGYHTSYKDFLSAVICDPPTPDCYLQKCPSCPAAAAVRNKLEEILQDNLIETVKYQQWTSTDRCSLETLVKNATDFVEMFMEMLLKLLPHHFIAKEQSKFYRDLKEKLVEGEVLCVCDFAENYSFIAQDSVQSYYWKNDQVTLHPFSCYFKLEGKIVCESFVVISNYMKHELSAVYTFQKVLMKFLRSKVPNFKKITYFSDGAAQQYKNKFNVLNVSYHYIDFGVHAEWHFFATSHGKGPCDGLAGTLKRNAYLSTLRGALIRSPEEFYDWAKNFMTGIDVCYVKEEEVLVVKEDLKPRLDTALGVPEMRDQHAILPVSQGEVKVRRYSAAAHELYVPVESRRNVPFPDHVQPGNFITVYDNKNWTLGEVIFCDTESGDVMVSVLTKAGLPNTFIDSDEPEELPYKLCDILCHVNPTVLNGVYALSKDDVTKTSWQFKLKKREVM